MQSSPGRTINPAWTTWKAQVDKCEEMIDRVKAAPNPHGPKWLRNTLAHYEGMKAQTMLMEPAKWVEDIALGEPGAVPPNDPRKFSRKKRR